MSTTPPSAPGVHEHVALPLLDETDAQPDIETPSTLKLITPSLETEAVIVIAPPNAALVLELGSEMVTVGVS